MEVVHLDPCAVGKKISTKCIGSNYRHDLTGEYKYADGKITSGDLPPARPHKPQPDCVTSPRPGMMFSVEDQKFLILFFFYTTKFTNLCP